MLDLTEICNFESWTAVCLLASPRIQEKAQSLGNDSVRSATIADGAGKQKLCSGFILHRAHKKPSEESKEQALIGL